MLTDQLGRAWSRNGDTMTCADGSTLIIGADWSDDQAAQAVASIVLQQMRAHVPEVVDMAQARLALLKDGLLHHVDAAIDAMQEPQRSAARIEWEYRTTVRRDSALTVQLGAALGLSDEQIDALFVRAAGALMLLDVRTDLLVPRGYDALCLWPLRLVRPAAAGDAGLYEHELVHAREQAIAQLAAAVVVALLAGSGWWLLLAITPAPVWFVPYLLVPRFRVAAEVRAYRRQIAVGGISIDAAARLLTTYTSGMSQAQACALLQDDHGAEEGSHAND